MSTRDAILSRRQVERLIAQGNTIIIVDGRVLRVDAWLRYHPGGDKAILHMVGRDATDEVNALHSAEARRRMNAFQIGRLAGPWKSFLPPIQGGTFVEDGTEEEDEEPVRGVVGDHEAESASGSDGAVSPVFDGVDKSAAVSTTTSVSSIDDVSPGRPTDPSMWTTSFLDLRTQEEIDLDLAKYPALDAAMQALIVQRYRQLDAQIRAHGLYQCNYWAYGVEGVRYVALFGLCLLLVRWGWYGTAGLCLGLFWHQLVFTAHDAGHMGITHHFQTDSVIGILVADFLGGLSIGWWKQNHNVHHIVTNSPEHDPDIEHLPFFAVSHRFFHGLRSTFYDRPMPYGGRLAPLAVRHQAWLYYPLLTLGRFNLYGLSWAHLARRRGPRHGPAAWHWYLEVAGQVCFWAWFGYGLVWAGIPTWAGRGLFVLVSHAVTMPLHVQITLSHFGMSTAELGVGECFAQRMLRTTMDVDCPAWLDFVHGGLQFQAVHHLFPRIPRHNLRAAQPLVRAFCRDVHIPYALFAFLPANRHVLGRLGDVARQAALLARCQREAARELADVMVDGKK
ncbi:MAG: hypothetical protein M1826_003347 [Phylliscum demangeonii]|nr:MAG: hypothetical protein M1826_003347 [Phylliscum demangeonii]